MTRRAFLALRVIRINGEFRKRVTFKKWEISITEMTRRAFLALRVIRIYGKSTTRVVVKKWEISITKMKISQNLCKRLSWEQFSSLGEGISYPEMHSRCLFMRLRKISLAGCVPGCRPKIRDFHEIWCFHEIVGNHQHFGSLTWKLKKLIFFRPCRGLGTWKGAKPPNDNQTWLVGPF